MARILVVDDVHFISKILAGLFEDRGHVVHVATDGEEALELARRDRPELILTDIAMPRVDGLEVTRRLKSDPDTAHIPVMAVTARSDVEAMRNAKEAGVDEYVLKPFDARRLLERATALLGGFPMNYSLELLGGVPVVTALSPELTGEAASQLHEALAAGRNAAASPLVLDLSRVRKVEATVVEELLRTAAASRSRRDGIHVVPPRSGMGVRSFQGRLHGRLELHDDLHAALRRLGVDPKAGARPVRLGAPAPGTSRPER